MKSSTQMKGATRHSNARSMLIPFTTVSAEYRTPRLSEDCHATAYERPTGGLLTQNIHKHSIVKFSPTAWVFRRRRSTGAWQSSGRSLTHEPTEGLASRLVVAPLLRPSRVLAATTARGYFSLSCRITCCWFLLQVASERLSSGAQAYPRAVGATEL